MDNLLEIVFNLCGIDLIPVAIPFLIYWIYCNRKVKHDLKGKVVLITGANSGLGEALAHVFHKAGCKLILAARRVDQLERVKSDLLKIKADSETFEPVIFPIDLSQLEAVPQKALDALAIYKHINILINNAGVSYRGNILETSLEVQMKVMCVNYFGQIALTNALLPSLIKCNGHIVAVSSIQGRIAVPFRSAYTASKHALQAYMDCLRIEIPEIKVTVISPGYIRTNLSVNAVTDSGEKYGVVDSTTAKGYSPEYVAEKILRAVIMEKKELIVSTFLPKMAILFRIISPSLFFYVIKLWAKRKK
uniref:Putative 11beta-hydroxysteroid dehydrogenase type 1 n=1 Tax=Panstrongylus lignarius TaxID=156445 RepID=A0A224XSW4_9HEMI